MIGPYLGSRIQPLDNSGNIGANIYIKFTEPGDPSTLRDVYTDYTLATPLTNPVQMDAYGRKPIWLSGVYDVYYYLGDPDDLINPGSLIYSDTNVNIISLYLKGVIDTLANLKAETNITDGRAIFLTDSNRGGEFVFSNADLSTEVTADTQNGIYVPPNSDTTGASGAWVRQYFGNINIQWFGASPSASATTNNTAIAAAIAYVVSIGGGTVYFPEGSYSISTNVVVGYSEVKLIGAGKGSYHATGTSPVAATQLVWAGLSTGTMVLFNPAGTQRITNNEFDGIYLNKGTGADYGIRVFSAFKGRFIISGRDFTTSLARFSCSSSLSEIADTQQNYIEIHGANVSTGGLAQFTGTSTANFSFNTIGYIDGNYKDGNAVQVYNADHNIFEHIRVFREAGGTAVGLVLAAGTSINECARANLFYNVSPGAGGVSALGTESSTVASQRNYILFYDTINSSPPPPSYGTGATLWYSTLDDKFPASAATTNTGTYGVGPTDVAFATEVFDVNGDYSTPSFTAPKPGKYRISWQLSHTNGVTSGDKWTICIVSTSESVCTIYYAPATDGSVSRDAIINMNKGDTVKMQITRASGTGNFPLVTDHSYNRFEIQYVSQSF